MPFKSIKRIVRRSARRARNWGTIVSLTLQGNTIEKKASLKKSKNPVLLLYGFGATRRTFSILEKRLYNDGFTVFSVNLGGIFGTFNTHAIEDLGAFIDQKIERLYEKYQFRGKISIISHSKGGLIGHYYVKRLGGERRVSSLITLGTPHNGNPWAMLAMFTPAPLILKSIAQMTPMCSFIKRLKMGPFPKKVKLYSLYSKDDLMCPYPSPVLDEAPNVKNIEIDGITHSEFLIKKNVYHIIRMALTNEVPTSLEEHTRKKEQKRKERMRKPLKLIEGAKNLIPFPTSRAVK